MARREHDFYPTPRWAVARLLEAVPLPDRVPWLEPCVGDGAIMRHVASMGYDVAWRTNDLRDVPQPITSLLHGHGRADAWLRDHGDRRAVCITNPPFKAAFEIVVASVATCGITVMLICPDAPSSTANTNYYWLAWGLGHASNDFLASTPSSERKRDEAAVSGVPIPHQASLFAEEAA